MTDSERKDPNDADVLRRGLDALASDVEYIRSAAVTRDVFARDMVVAVGVAIFAVIVATAAIKWCWATRDDIAYLDRVVAQLVKGTKLP